MRNNMISAVEASQLSKNEVARALELKQLRIALAQRDATIAQLKEKSRFKTSPAMRAAQKRYNDTNREKVRARNRGYMRAKRAEQRARKENQ